MRPADSHEIALRNCSEDQAQLNPCCGSPVKNLMDYIHGPHSGHRDLDSFDQIDRHVFFDPSVQLLDSRGIDVKPVRRI